MKRILLPAALALAVSAPAASAWEETVHVTPLGCGVTVGVTEVFLLLSNPPKVGTSGYTGASTDCL